MKKKYFLLILILSLSIFSSCLRLDAILFNNDNNIKQYLYDDYKGEVDFTLDSSYEIPSNFITEFTLNSQADGENKPTIIYAVYIGDISKISTDTVIVYNHGTRDHNDFYWQRAKLMANTGWKNRFGVLMIDYRGYGLSQGKPTEEGMYADVDAGLQWLKLKGLSNDRLIMYGFSLGSAPTCELTANPKSMTPSKIILEAPFASSAVMVQDAAKLNLPASYFTDLKIDNAEEIKKIKKPFLWMHGIDDSFLSITSHGEIIFKNYSGTNGVPVRITGAEHGTIPQTLGFREYNNTLLNFILK